MSFLKSSYLSIPILLIIFTSLLYFSCKNSNLTAEKKYKLIEEVTAKKGSVTIPYKKYQLDNGLQVIIHEDMSDPLVHVDVTFHVGSAREELKKSGFAHFFEHMLFQGSENVKDEEHFKIVSESGGTLNGSTNKDRTNYYETVPVNQLETVLWLESDRMGYFLDSVTQKKFEIQRSTVKNEKGQNYYNRPYGQLFLLRSKALYPYGHPYSWPTIGEIEDLNRVDVEDLKKFFLRWYGPNNAVLTLAGQVKAEEVMPMVQKYFGDIQRGEKVERMKLDRIKLEKNRYVSYVDKNIQLPALYMVWPTVPTQHPDEAPLDCLAEILGTGNNSYMYKKFVEKNIAIQTSVYNPASELAGEFVIGVYSYPKIPLSKIEENVREVFKEFEENGVSDEDLKKFKNSFEVDFIQSFSTASGKASTLARYQTYSGDANLSQKVFDDRMKITKEDVMRVFKKYIKDQFALIISVLPEEAKGMRAKEDNYSPPTSGESTFPTVDYSKMVYKKNSTQFDRSKRPIPSPNPLISIPNYWEEKIHGVKTFGMQSTELPTVDIILSIKGGMKLENVNNAGISSLMADLMNEGTKDLTSAEFSDTLLKLGSNIFVTGERARTSIYVNTLKKNFKETISLLEKVLLTPRFDEKDFEKVKIRTLEAIKHQFKNPSTIASLAFRNVIYDKNDVRGLPVFGTIDNVKKITLENVKNFYANNISLNLAKMVVVGDIEKKEVIDAFEFFNKWEDKNVKVPKYMAVQKREKPIIYFIDKPNAPQSRFNFGYKTDLKYDPTGEYFKTYLMNYSFGRAFNSRINLNLREDKGVTYGARSFLSNNGIWRLSTGIKGDKTDLALSEVLMEMRKYNAEGITPEELDFTKKAISQSDALKYESNGAKAKFLRRILRYNLDKNYVQKQSEIIKNITKSEIDQLAKKYIDVNKNVFIIVGDKKSLIEDIKKHDISVKELMLDDLVKPSKNKENPL